MGIKDEEFFEFMDGLVDSLELCENYGWKKISLQLKDIKKFGKSMPVKIFKKLFKSLFKGAPHFTAESTCKIPIKEYHISGWIPNADALKIYQDYRQSNNRKMTVLNNELMNNIKIMLWRRDPYTREKRWFEESVLIRLRCLKKDVSPTHRIM